MVSTMNSLDGRIKANAAIVRRARVAAVSVFVTDTTDVVLDIDGYFAPPAASTLAVLSADAMPRGRHAQDRLPARPGRPHLVGRRPRDFPVLNSHLQHSGEYASAYSLQLHRDSVSGAGRSAGLSGSVADRKQPRIRCRP